MQNKLRGTYISRVARHMWKYQPASFILNRMILIFCEQVAGNFFPPIPPIFIHPTCSCISALVQFILGIYIVFPKLLPNIKLHYKLIEMTSARGLTQNRVLSSLRGINKIWLHHGGGSYRLIFIDYSWYRYGITSTDNLTESVLCLKIRWVGRYTVSPG